MESFRYLTREPWRGRSVLRRLILLSVSAGVLMSVPLAAGPQRRDVRKVDRAVERALERQERRLRVIVKMKPGYRRAMRQSLERHGDAVHGELASIDALTVDLHADDIASMMVDDAVEAVSIDAEVRVEGKSGWQKQRQRDIARGMDEIRETLGLKGNKTDGRDVVIALIDTGLDPALDFDKKAILAFYDFTRGGIPSRPFDDHGHGTHVASLIGADGGKHYEGIASRVRFVGLKVLDRSGGGYTSDVIAAIEFAVANKDRFGIDIINLSLGHPIFEPADSDPLVQAVEAAVRAGIVVVASAGNFGRNEETGEPGYAGITSPGNAPSAITIGAVDTGGTVDRDDDRVPVYSSRGPTWYDAYAKPDVVAPGDELIGDTGGADGLYARYPKLRVYGDSGYYYMALSGTSMAAGVATGVVAHVLEASRKANKRGEPLPPNAIKAILQYTAIPLRDANGLPYDRLTQGAGGLNARGAVELASLIDTSTPVGGFWLTKSIEPFTRIDRETYAWAQHIVWGEHIVWGDSVLTRVEAWARNIVWGEARNIVWGNASNVVWGENVVWGNAVNIVWGNHIVWGNAFNIVWGNAFNIVWGNAANIVWGNLAEPDAGAGSP